MMKCHPEPFQAVKRWEKNFEFRKDDRDYRVGDMLHLSEWDPECRKECKYGSICTRECMIPQDCDRGRSIGYTGDKITRTVTYIIREGFGIPEGYCIMALAGQQDKQPSPSVLPVFTEEEIERKVEWISRNCDIPFGAVQDAIRKALRYANTKAVSVDRLMEVVENEFPVDDKYPYDDRIVNPAQLRTLITSLFNGEG